MPLPEGGVSMQEAVEQWLVDTDQYNDLADRHNVLVTWVLESC